MEKLSFGECTRIMLEKKFGLKRQESNETLAKLLAMPYTPDGSETGWLKKLQKKFLLNSDDWNEQELSSYFIIPIFGMVEFTTPYFNDFAQRPISCTIGECQLLGRPDGLIASGRGEPETPFFVFQEYKPQTDPKGEPIGQCLAAMLAGQTLNENPALPVYGCVVIGKMWQFMVLEGKNYCQSTAFVPDDEEIFDIYRILQGLKTTLLRRFEPNDEL